MSRREYAALKLGGSKNDYNEDGSKKGSGSSKDTGKSSDQKTQEKNTGKYYDEDKKAIEAKKEDDDKRLSADISAIMRDSGITITQSMADYIKNLGKINRNEANDLADVADYVATKSQQTQEDLNTGLAKESRRYQIEFDKTNQALADAGMTFSERKQEKVDAAGNAFNVGDINTAASRSFADIARYQFVQNRDTAIKYGDLRDTNETSKNRSIETAINAQADAIRKAEESGRDTGYAYDKSIRDNIYGKSDAISNIGSSFAEQNNQLSNDRDKNTLLI